MKPIICFIDDSEFEHDLVLNEIAHQTTEVEFLTAYTFDEARAALKSSVPSLFLLDLWGQDPALTTPAITPKGALEEQAMRIPDLESVFDGLEDFKGDRNNEYLKRLFRIVDGWRDLFEAACARVGQNRKYGLSNLKKAREYYPETPAVFYTRKSLISDAVAMIRAGCDGLFIKPTGPDDPQTRRLTREYAPDLLADLSRIMKSKPSKSSCPVKTSLEKPSPS